MKFGIFGGAFNPVHIAHLNTASEVMFKMGLERVHFVVSARPPHKDDGDLIDAEKRFTMLELACAGNENFLPSRVELDRPGSSYTIDTVRYFKEKYGEGASFILGQDAMEDIASWHSAAALLKMCDFIVVTRPGYDPSAFFAVLQGVLAAKYKNLNLIDHGPGDAGGALHTIGVQGAQTVISLVRVTQMDVASSTIRARIRSGEPIKYLVPAAVETYIREEGLLSGDNAGG